MSGKDEIVISANTFFDRLSVLYTSWKADKRSGDILFGGADSIVVLTGKAEQESNYNKNNAIHVSSFACAGTIVKARDPD